MKNNYCYNCFENLGENNTGPCSHCGYDPTGSEGKYPFALPHGSILAGQYIIGRVLGQGGFGITYLALDKKLNMKVAIKEFLPDGIAVRAGGSHQVTTYTGQREENFKYGMDRFLDEAQVLAKFQGNPNIVGVRSYFEENDTAYFVMDYIEGTSFKTYIQEQGGKVSWEESVRVLLPVMDALGAVHKEGIIHRDVTPDNIILTTDGGVKLLDFGSARYSLGDKSKSLDVVLKAGYAPKEQYIRRGKQGPYTDVYSLAACFYAAITGFLPPESLERMDEDNLVPPSTRGFKLPSGFEDAILKGLEVQPADRYQSMEEFRAAVDAAVRNTEAVPVKSAVTAGVTAAKSVAAESAVPAPSANARLVSESEKQTLTDSKKNKLSLLERVKALPTAAKGGMAAAACFAVILCALAANGTFSGGKDAPVSGNNGGGQNSGISQFLIEDGSSSQPDAPAISTPEENLPSEPVNNPAPNETVQDTPPAQNTTVDQSSEPSQTEVPKKIEEPKKTEDPKKPAEPAKPTKDELEAAAKDFLKNNQYEQLEDCYRQMYALGYTDQQKFGGNLGHVGYCYKLAKNYGEAERLWLEAANLGTTSYLDDLGHLYRDYLGNDDAAFQWYMKAANSGDSATRMVYIAIGECYKEGRGVAKDLNEALKWLEAYKAFGYAQGLESTNRLIKEVKAELEVNTVKTVTNEPYTMKTSKFSVKGTYTGEWKDGKPNGEGTMTMSQDDDRWNKGDTLWSKSWSNGLIEGYGQWRSAKDGAYDGNFSKGLKSGYGKMWFSDGTVYDGQWSGGDFVG